VSFLDFLFVGLVGVQRGRLVRFLAKESVFRPPLLGGAMRRMGHVSVDRAHGAGALRQAVRAARSGEVLGVFPEAMFSRNGTLRPFRRGAAAVAVWDQVPLLPVVVWGGQDVLSVRPWWFRLRRGAIVTVVVGEPLRPGPHADPAAVTEALRARVDDLLRGRNGTPDRELSPTR
jgi:1-acyl-sn-glycerol-3-phosphate acyltransferase